MKITVDGSKDVDEISDNRIEFLNAAINVINEAAFRDVYRIVSAAGPAPGARRPP
jgi:hypothetical protein